MVTTTIIGEAWLAVMPEMGGFERTVVGKLRGLAAPGGPLAVAGVAAAGAAVAGLFSIGEGFEKAFNQIRQQTGATDAEMGKLEGSFKRVFANTAGATMGNVADSLSLIHQRTGLAGEALEKFARKEIELGKITKTDVGQNVQNTTALFNKFGIEAKYQADYLDVLYKASLKGGKGLQQLTSDLTATRGVTASMGLDLTQSAALLSQLEAKGLNATQAMMALNRGMTTLAKQSAPPSAKALDSLKEAAARADAALSKARTSSGAAGDAVAAMGAKTADMAQKSLGLAEGALAKVNARIEDHRTKSLALHGVFTMNASDSAVLAAAQNRVAAAQAKLSGGGEGGAGRLATAQSRVADAVAKAAEAHRKLSEAQHAGGATAVDIKAKMTDLFNQIKGAATEQDALNIAASTFGVRGGRELGLAIRSGALDFDSFAKQLTGAYGAIDKTTEKTLTLGDKFHLLKNRTLVALEPMSMKIVELANVLFDKLPAAFHRVQVVMEPVVNFIRHHATESLAALAAVGTVLLIPMIAAAVLAIPPLIGAIGGIVVAAAPLLAVAAIAFGLVWAYKHIKIFHEAVDAVVRFFREKVIPVFLAVPGALAATIRWFERLPDTMRNAVGHILTFFKQLPGHVGSALLSLGQNLLDAFGRAISGLVAALPGLAGSLLEWWITLPLTIIGLYVDADKWLIQTGLKVLKGLLDGAIAFLPTLWGWVRKLPGLYVKAIETEAKAALWLAGIGLDVIKGLLTGAYNFFLHDAVPFFTKLPGLIINIIKNVGGGAIHWLEDVAKDLIKGLGQGMVKWAESTVGHIPFIGGKIVDEFKKALGVKSPSVIFHAIGLNLMQGLTNGIITGSDLVHRALGGLGLNVPALAFGGVTGPSPSTSFAASKLDVIATSIAELNHHLRTRPQLVVHQKITPTEPKASGREAVRLLAAAGYRNGRS